MCPKKTGQVDIIRSTKLILPKYLHFDFFISSNNEGSQKEPVGCDKSKVNRNVDKIPKSSSTVSKLYGL
ncbi:hypothetical protein Mapa_010520 [Marchantia paleacea]|nr:hypothetical protein Mapa_010520 [Marchantia paleacea]